MAVATAKKIDQRQTRPQAQYRGRPARPSTTASPSSDMAPLWKVMGSVVTKEPVTRCQPHVWHYDDVKSLVMESGGLITAEEAKRRVLVLENPAHARRIQGHQHAVRRHPDDPARRGRAGPPPRLLRHPLRARRRGRLYGGRRREVLHVARRFRHHRQLGAARSRQHRRRSRCCGSTCSTSRRSISSRPRSPSISTSRPRRPRARTAIR